MKNKNISLEVIKKISQISKIEFSKQEIAFFITELEKSLQGVNEILQYADDDLKTPFFNMQSINQLRQDNKAYNDEEVIKGSGFFDNKYIKV